ncbi:MAG: caspase family protein [Microcoleaceae cyanobacterium]
MKLDNAYALIVGIANYQKINPLPATVLKDAQDIYNLLVSPEHCGYSSNNVQLLLDDQATQTNLRQSLKTLAQNSNNESSVLLYISSHGGQAEYGPHAGEYLLPVDADCSSGIALAQTAIASTEFTEVLRAISARKLVVIFDCCYSGGIGQPKDATAPILQDGLSENFYDILKQGQGRVILASSRSNEKSYILPGATNSLFTQHLLDGLRGGVIAPGGVIRILDLFSYIQPKVTRDISDQQHPIMKAEIEENFPIALYLGGKSATPLPATVISTDSYEYDVFISYEDQGTDKSWVRKTVLPYLESKGLKVNLDIRFPLGPTKIIKMENAVQKSRYTLIILSPTYLKNSFTNFENLMAQHLGLEQSKNRLIPLLREPCNPRLGLRILFMLDMSDEEEFDINMERLVYQLKQTPTS